MLEKSHTDAGHDDPISVLYKKSTSVFRSGTVKHSIGIRIQHFRLNTDPDLDSIRIQGFDDKKLEKNTGE